MQVDFYLSPTTELAAQPKVACQLTEAIVRKGYRVYLHCNDSQAAQQLDDELWRFRQNSFIPHSQQLTDHEVAVFIGCNDQRPPQCEVLINCADAVPNQYHQFQRVVEFVIDHEQQKQASRQRFKQYRQAGCTLQTHALKTP